jgi:mannose-1-phosphate guanylyltransferase
MLLCAGLGARLDPLSGLRPKPLFPACGRSMLGRWLDRLEAAGVRRVAVNIHHMADDLIGELAWEAAGRPKLEIRPSPEPELLGTGGGLKKAADRMGDFLGPSLFVVNVDIATDISLPLLAERHLELRRPPATLALVDRPAKATVSLGSGGAVLGFRSPGKLPGEAERWCGAGIMVFERRALEGAPDGPFDLIDLLARQSRAPAGLRFAGAYWRDMGTLAEYWRLNRDLARGAPGNGHLPPRFPPPDLNPMAVSAGFLAAEPGVEIGDGAVVQDSVLWRGASIGVGAVVTGSVVAGRIRAGAVVAGSVVAGLVGEGAVVADSIVRPKAPVGPRALVLGLDLQAPVPEGTAPAPGAGAALAGAKDEDDDPAFGGRGLRLIRPPAEPDLG